MSKLELSLINYADYTSVNDISNALLRDIRQNKDIVYKVDWLDNTRRTL